MDLTGLPQPFLYTMVVSIHHTMLYNRLLLIAVPRVMYGCRAYTECEQRGGPTNGPDRSASALVSEDFCRPQEPGSLCTEEEAVCSSSVCALRAPCVPLRPTPPSALPTGPQSQTPKHPAPNLPPIPAPKALVQS